MKKTFATLLILTLVASVCGMLFASAVDPVEELKAELEALVGDVAADAAFDWVAEMEADDNGLVTVTLTVDVVDGREVSYVYGEFYYNTDELTLLNTIAGNDADYSMVDCLTSAPSDAYENFSVLKPGADGVIVLNILNADENINGLTGSDSLVLTLKFRLADGVKLTGVYIPTASVEGGEYTYLEPEYLSPVVGNGDYAMLYIEDKESSDETSDVISDETSDVISDETSDVISDETSDVTSDESSDVPSQPDDSSEEPDESSDVPSQPDDSSEEPDESSDVPSQPDDSSEEPDESSDVPSQPDDSSEEPDESSDVPSQPEESSEEPDESSDVPSQPDDSSEESSVASSEASSETESSEPPKPGDSGVLLFAILGLLAIAGAAIAIKARR